MLKSLLIRNYALIEELEMDFGPGLTIISGETGAGKSIILGAIDLITGKRADTSVLMNKDKKCIVEAVFDVSNYHLEDFFNAHDLDYEALTTVRREMSPSGRSRAFINDTPVNLPVLQRLGSSLIDIHSQHQNILLGSNVFQLQVLDAFTHRQDLTGAYQRAYKDYQHSKQVFSELRELARQAGADLDYLQFQFEELDKADLHDDEQERLEGEMEVLSHAEEIKNALLYAWTVLQENEQAVVVKLKDVVHTLQRIRNYLPEVGDYVERLETAYIDLKDLAGELEVKGNDIEYEPGRMEQVRERLNLIYHLEDKHRVKTVAGLLAIRNDLDEKIARIGSYDEELARAESQLAAAREKLWALGKELTEIRRSAREEIEKAVVGLLRELGIPAARFHIEITDNPEPGPYGFDQVSFLFSANTQASVQEIGKIASGGELSRLMLSLKSLLTESVGLPTIIFDEIDTGVSGDIADRVGQIIARMGEKMQVVNITHLPQIASKGKEHYLVYKTDANGKTRTQVKKLTPEERITEIAKLLSGRELSEAAYQNARELLKISGNAGSN